MPENPTDLDFSGLTADDLLQARRRAVDAQSAIGEEEVSALHQALATCGVFLLCPRGRKGPRTDGQPPAVVVVDDDPSTRSVVLQVLKSDGYSTYGAATGGELATVVRGIDVLDLLILDVGLPDVSGFQVLAAVRKNPKMASVPVLMLTGAVEPEDLIRGIQLGVDGYLSKPAKAAALRAAARAILQRGSGR